MLVLDGNIPRFPREPSPAMLTNRLVGTTEASVSYRGGRHHSGCPTVSSLWVATGDRVAQSSLVTASSKGALRC